jgi:hypothetical protein
VDDLIIASQDPRLTNLIFDAAVTHNFINLPVFSISGQRLLPTHLRDIAGALVELTFTARTPRASSADIAILLSSLHVIH